MTTKQIEMGKQYKLANGWEYRLYAVDGAEGFPVHGAWFNPVLGQWQSCVHTREGFFSPLGNISNFNLIEIPKRIKRKVWVNVYEDFYSISSTRDLAESAHRFFQAGERRRLACIPITIDCDEGEGLDGGEE